MFSSGAMLSFQKNRNLLRKRAFLDKENYLRKIVANDNLSRQDNSITEKRFDKIQQRANAKAFRLLFLVIGFLFLVGYLMFGSFLF